MNDGHTTFANDLFRKLLDLATRLYQLVAKAQEYLTGVTGNSAATAANRDDQEEKMSLAFHDGHKQGRRGWSDYNPHRDGYEVDEVLAGEWDTGNASGLEEYRKEQGE